MTEPLRLATADSVPDGFFALAARAAQLDGQPPFNDRSLALVRAGAVLPILALEDERIVGACVRHHGEFELVVHPAERGRGHGAALAAAIVQGSPRGTLAWAHGDLPASRRLAERFGFEPVRTLLQLRADLGAIAARSASVPGILIRPFSIGADEDAWVALNALVFARHPEQGALTADDLVAREREGWFDAGDFVVAVDDDGVMVGYDWVKIDPAEPEIGEIYVLGVHPGAAGRGIGRLLLETGVERMRRRGATTAALYVEADNTAAVALYRSVGFVDHTVDVQYRLR